MMLCLKRFEIWYFGWTILSYYNHKNFKNIHFILFLAIYVLFLETIIKWDIKTKFKLVEVPEFIEMSKKVKMKII